MALSRRLTSRISTDPLPCPSPCSPLPLVPGLLWAVWAVCPLKASRAIRHTIRRIPRQGYTVPHRTRRRWAWPCRLTCPTCHQLRPTQCTWLHLFRAARRGTPASDLARHWRVVRTISVGARELVDPPRCTLWGSTRMRNRSGVIRTTRWLQVCYLGQLVGCELTDRRVYK